MACHSLGAPSLTFVKMDLEEGALDFRRHEMQVEMKSSRCAT